MSWRPMVTTEFTASLMSSAAKEEGMVGLKQRPNTATDSATGPMTEVTTPTPRERCKAVGSPCRFCPRAAGALPTGHNLVSNQVSQEARWI